MFSRIVSLKPGQPGGYEPLLEGTGKDEFMGTPLLLGYEMGGAPCGVLAADCFDAAITVRWLCVDSACQGRGIAGALLDELCALADEQGVESLDAVISGEEDRPIRSLLLDRGFVREDASPVYRFPLSAVLQGPLSAALGKEDPRIIPLRSAPAYLIRDLNRRIAASNGVAYPPIDVNALLEESLAWLENGEITACLILAECDGGVEIRWIYSRSKNPAVLQGLFAGAAGAISRKYPPQTWIHAAAMAPNVDAVIRRLTGDQLVAGTSVVRFCRRLDRGEERNLDQLLQQMRLPAAE